MIEKCRLCSSSTALISLTSGKRRQSRDYIRKLIEITTGIQFKKNDVLNVVCFTCMVQIYNFYLFRTRSLQNEKILQELTKEQEMVPQRNKVPIPDLCDIATPDVEDLKNILLPWLQSKLKSMECEYENSTLSGSDNTETSKKTDVDQCSEISTQTTASTVVMVDEEVQVGPPTTWNVSSQTFIKTADERIQCHLLTPTTEVFSQTDFKYEGKVAQNVHIFETKDEGIQCEILESDAPLMKFETYSESDYLMNAVPIIPAYIEKRTSGDTVLKAPCQKNGKLEQEIDTDKDVTFLTALCLKSKHDTDPEKVVFGSPQRDTRQARLKQASVSPINRESSATEKYITKNEQSLVKVSRENYIRNKETALRILENGESKKQIGNIPEASEIISSQSVSESLCSEKLPPEKFSDNKSRINQLNEEEIEGKSVSPRTPNKKKQVDSGEKLHIPDRIEPNCLKYDSPRSSQLLDVKNKVQYVKICRECDHTMYSKGEVVTHRKSHMRCPMCKKKFTSILKTKLHMSLECDEKIASMIPVVSLDKITVPDILRRFPHNKELVEINSPNKKRKNHSLLSSGKKFKG